MADCQLLKYFLLLVQCRLQLAADHVPPRGRVLRLLHEEQLPRPPVQMSHLLRLRLVQRVLRGGCEHAPTRGHPPHAVHPHQERHRALLRGGEQPGLRTPTLFHLPLLFKNGLHGDNITGTGAINFTCIVTTCTVCRSTCLVFTEMPVRRWCVPSAPHSPAETPTMSRTTSRATSTSSTGTGAGPEISYHF